jgi:predicted transcriptional regulator of viral defense system
MGTKVHIDELRRFARSTPAFKARDAEILVKDRGYALLMLHNLAKQGELSRVTRGWYSVLKDPVVSVFTLQPAYLGLQEALSIRNLWEQETNVVVVTAGKAKPGIRKALGETVIVHRIDPAYFFGFDYVRYGDFHVPVSDREKTLIDLVYFDESPGAELLRQLARDADRRVLTRYLRRYPSSFVTRLRKALGRGIS